MDRTAVGVCRPERRIGRSDRIEDVLEALLVDTGARRPFEPHSPPTPSLDDVHMRRPGTRCTFVSQKREGVLTESGHLSPATAKSRAGRPGRVIRYDLGYHPDLVPELSNNGFYVSYRLAKQPDADCQRHLNAP